MSEYEDGYRYIIGVDFTLGERYCPRLITFQDKEGILYTDEVSEEEYLRIMSGQGSTPRADPAYTVLEVFAELERVWSDRIPPWEVTIVIGDDEDHIIRSEN